MHSRPIALFLSALLCACSNPHDTPLPKNLAQMDATQYATALKPAMDKLSAEDKQLLAGYVLRIHFTSKMGRVLGGQEGPGIPDGMTIGKAIEEQRKVQTDVALKKANQK